MAKCVILVDLDEPHRRYAPGDVVSGQVTVHVNEACKCSALVIEQRWSTHGRGNETVGVHDQITAFSGEWAADTEHAYVFEFTVPDGPYTYHGHYLNVDWYIRASADIPWALDPDGEADFLLGPGPETDPETYTSTGDTHTGIEKRRTHNPSEAGIGLFFFGIPFLGTGAYMMHMAVNLDDGGAAALWVFPFGLLFAAAGLWMMYRSVRNRMAKMKLGRVDVDVPQDMLQPGQEVPVHVQIDSSAREHLNEVRAALICRERVVSGSGTNKTTHSKEVYSQAVDLVEETEQRFVDGQRLSMDTTFRLPEDAPLSFYARNNELQWLVDVHVDVARWPDWKREHFIDVRPKDPTAEAAETADKPAQTDADQADSEMEEGVLW